MLIVNPATGKAVAFVRDVEWYTRYNFGLKGDSSQEAMIEEARAKTMKVRKAVVESGGIHTVKVTNKRIGKDSFVKYEDNKLVPIFENNPQTALGYWNGTKFITDKGEFYEDTVSIHEGGFDTGHIYEIRRSNVPDRHIAFKPHYGEIGQDVQHSLYNAAMIFLDYNKVFQEEAEAFKKASGIDLNTLDGLITHFKNFVRIDTRFKNDIIPGNNYGEVEQNANEYYSTDQGFEGGTPYIFTQKVGKKIGIYFGVVGVLNDNGKQTQKLFSNNSQIKSEFTYFLSQMKVNINERMLTDDAQMVLMDSQMNSYTSKKKYKDYAAERIRTNVKSFNVGTETNPYYVTSVVPVVEYELSNTVARDVESGNISTETVEKVSDKISKSQPLNPTEEEVVNAKPKEVAEVVEQKAEDTAKEVIEQDTEDAPTEIPQEALTALRNAYKLFEENGNVNGQEAIRAKVRQLGGKIDEEGFFSPSQKIDPMQQEASRTLFGDLFGLTILQNSDIVKAVYNKLATKFDFKKGTVITQEELLKSTDESVRDNVFIKGMEKQEAAIKSLEEAYSVFPDESVAELIEEAKNTLVNYHRVIDNWTNKQNTGIRDQAFKLLKKWTTGSEGSVDTRDEINVDDQIGELDVETDQIYSKTSLEEWGKDNSSYRLRRFLNGIIETTHVVRKDGKIIKDVTVSYDVEAGLVAYDTNNKLIRGAEIESKIQKGYLGVNRYVGFNKAYDIIKETLNSPSQSPSTVEDVISRLAEHTVANPWLVQVIERLKSDQTDSRIPQEMVYNMVDHNASYKFVMFEKKKNGTYRLSVYDSNAGDIVRVIRNRWKENLKSNKTELTYVNEEGQYMLRHSKLKELVQQYETEFVPKLRAAKAKNNKGAKADISIKAMSNWLAQMGIEVSDKTLIDVKKRGMWVGSDNKPVTFNNLFVTPKGKKNQTKTAGLFGALYNTLNQLASRGQDLEFIEEPKNSPIGDIGNIGDSLARIESRYNLYTTTKTFRDGGKSFSGFIAPTHSTETIDKLKQDEEFRNQLKNKVFNRHSYILKMIDKNYKLRDKISISQLGNTAIKEKGASIYGKNSITDLPDADHEGVKLGMFMDKNQGASFDVHSSVGFGRDYIKTRMARMFVPTMSDKSRMSLLHIPVLDVTSKHIDLENNRLDDGLLDIIYSQMVKPELDRIVKYHKDKKRTNIKGYDHAAKMFNFLPSINNIEHEGQSILLHLEENSGKYTTEYVEEVLMEQIRDKINEYIFNEISRKIKLSQDGIKEGDWVTAGFLGRNENNDEVIQFLDETYMSQYSGDIYTKLRMAAADFVINSNITNANTHMLLSGDIALYGKNSTKEYFKDGEVYLPNKEKFGEDVYQLHAKELGTNLGKRLANQVAPGRKLAMKKNEKYIQLYLNDFFDHSTNITMLASKLDKKELSNSDLQLIREINANANGDGTLTQGQKDKYKNLKKRFPNTAPYFELESTDAQEYTTASEHLRVLWGQGRLDKDTHTKLKNKIKKQRKAERNNDPIPDDAKFDHEELTLFFQPMKPVYTGFINDEVNGVMRTVYIKSSSIPLLPQVTSGLEIDGLRKLMEGYENDSGLKVRASYESANKVGANTNAIHVFDKNGKFNSRLLNGIGEEAKKERNREVKHALDEAVLVLNRESFKIQQDVPFKLDKNEVTLGTQTLKLLFGNGVTEMEGFSFRGNDNVSGKELRDRFNKLFNDYISDKRLALLEELGMNTDGTAKDPVRTKKKIQKLLKKEAEERGYPRQDIEALKLTEVRNSQGRIIDYKFKLPPWISPNSNKYESLLNSIINSRTVKMKMPGTSYVVASEAGFQRKANISNKEVQSRIIYTDKWEGKLKAADLEYYTNNEGKQKKRVKSVQVLAPSKFRDINGELVKLILDNGEPNPLYVEKDENGVLRLKEGMLESGMKDMFTFRIPTSSHVSMSKVEIVGFLPPEVGNMLIVPKNLTQQKGLDFDIDKETAYYNHTYVTGTGKIVPFGGKEWQIDADIVQEKFDIIEELYQENKDLLKDEQTLTDLYLNAIENGTVKESVLYKKRLDEVKSLKSTDLTQDDYFAARKEYEKFHGTKAKQKVMENEMVDIHMSVISNEQMFEKVNKVLSMASAKEQSIAISSQAESDSLANFSILSDTYQKSKMALGSSGKLGIGVYSNFVVLNSQIQQTDSDHYLQYTKEDGTTENFNFNIGGIKSDGRISNSQTLGTIKRDIADVLAERQNTATDNEKEQIMGRVNINSQTINFDVVMILLGYDKTPMHYVKYFNEETGQQEERYFETQKEKQDHIKKVKKDQKGLIRISKDYSELSIPYAFTSQPIIREYTEMMKAGKSKFQEYNPSLETDVIGYLMDKYNFDEDIDPKDLDAKLTGETLFRNLSKPEDRIQTRILQLFQIINGQAKELSELQKVLNINNGGLGRSFFDVIEKYDNLAKGGFGGQNLSNRDDLIGDILYFSEEQLEGGESFDDLLEQRTKDGYFYFQDRYSTEIRKGTFVKPTTPSSSMLIQSIHTGYNLWKDYYPYSSVNVSMQIDNIRENILGKRELSSQKKSEVNQEIFAEMRKYLLASSKFGLFTGDIQKKRAKLFFDTKENTSLAQFLKDKMLTDERLQNNKLLSRFEFKLESNGLPSLIKYDNTQNEDFDEDYLYIALLELMQEDRSLGEYQGREYTTKDLAKDLVTYSYLGEPVQEAIQFLRYIPISYLESVGFSDNAAKMDEKIRPGIFDTLLGKKRFAEQYAQHNAGKLTKIDLDASYISNKEYGVKKSKESLMSFSVNYMADSMTEGLAKKLDGKSYVTFYNKNLKKGTQKYQVYKAIRNSLGTITHYQRISVLGVHGLSEYQLTRDTAPRESLVNPIYKKTSPKPIPATPEPENNKTLTLGQEVESLSKSTDIPTELQELAKVLLPKIDTSINIEEVYFASKFPKYSADEGVYQSEEHKIYLNKGNPVNATKAGRARVLLHEVVHALTVRHVFPYIKKDGKATIKLGPDGKSKEVSPEIVGLIRVFKEARASFDSAVLDSMESSIESGTSFSSNEARMAYGVKDIYEFMSMLTTDKEFRDRMSKIPYKNTNKSIWEKFIDSIRRIIGNITGIEPNSIAMEGIGLTLEIVEQQSKTAKNLFDIMEDNVQATLDLLSEATPDNPMPGITAVQTDEKPIDDSYDEKDVYESRTNTVMTSSQLIAFEEYKETLEKEC
jgi:hypothetical protein